MSDFVKITLTHWVSLCIIFMILMTLLKIHHFCQFVTKRHPKLALSSKYLGAFSGVGPSKITYRLYLIESKLIKIVHCVTIYCNLNFFIVSTYAPIIFDRVLHSLNYSQNRQFHWHFFAIEK